MSWLARSFANSLRLDPDDDGDDPFNGGAPYSSGHPPPPPSSSSQPDRPDDDWDTQSEETQSRGVKEDLSELGQTLTRQFWGVASFLAPPTDPDRSDRSGSGGARDATPIRSDFDEVGGGFGSGVLGVSRTGSDLIRVQEEEVVGRDGDGGDDGEEVVMERNGESEEFFNDEDEIDVVGITHEVLAFARNIAMHPETWLDFPLDEEEEPDDFDMSEAQQEHAFAIEQLSPRLAALRIELCPCHMSLGYFWKVYFVLLHSRLNKYDAEILSSPQVMEARAKWMKELHEQTKPDANPDYSPRSNSDFRDESNSIEEDEYCPSENKPFWSFSSEPTTSYANTDYETDKHPDVSTEIPLIDKSVIEEEQISKTKDIHSHYSSSSKIPVPDFDDDDDKWLEDEDLDLQRYGPSINIGNEDDISFSDLEDDDNHTFPKKLVTISKDDAASLKTHENRLVTSNTL